MCNILLHCTRGVPDNQSLARRSGTPGMLRWSLLGASGCVLEGLWKNQAEPVAAGGLHWLCIILGRTPLPRLVPPQVSASRVTGVGGRGARCKAPADHFCGNFGHLSPDYSVQYLHYTVLLTVPAYLPTLLVLHYVCASTLTRTSHCYRIHAKYLVS